MIIRVRLPARSGHISKVTTPKIINNSGAHKSLFFTFAAQFIPPRAVALGLELDSQILELLGELIDLLLLGKGLINGLAQALNLAVNLLKIGEQLGQ